jgi:hypothetical protein
VRLDRIGAVILGAFALAPTLLHALWAARAPSERREAPLVLLLQSLLLPAILGPIVWTAVDRRGRGLVLSAVRGGREAAIEVRPRRGEGHGLVIPIAEAGALARLHRVGVARHIATAEALTPTAAGEVLFARGGTSLDPDLVRWIERVWASDGSSAPSPGAIDVEEIAARAARDPSDAPSSLHATLRDGWPTYAYRAVEPRGIALAASLIATFLIWLVLYPVLGTFSVAKLAAWILPVVLVLGWLIVLAGPLTVEVEVRGPMVIFRRRRFGLALWASVSDARQAGLEISQLPFVALRFGRRLRGFTTPDIGGPDVAAMAWLSAAIRACAQRGPWRA